MYETHYGIKSIIISFIHESIFFESPFNVQDCGFYNYNEITYLSSHSYKWKLFDVVVLLSAFKSRIKAHKDSIDEQKNSSLSFSFELKFSFEFQFVICLSLNVIWIKIVFDISVTKGSLIIIAPQTINIMWLLDGQNSDKQLKLSLGKYMKRICKSAVRQDKDFRYLCKWC